ncbi:helix-turn-helix domain-containing GNAT family N-acetyltransferase [Sphingobacterium sp. lm-10]|uniref:bifunctional helix-turn-helix transcriptional regulator/GNAT family N-acetyltransferase n=1 Tax=Sphingobacterium sp. lm-10 TaxID=2944904 RepID=UPI0020227DD8|nr:helix-turn-helix domain-containing GNAT family N-acetyltransferase [Sphingobacterium sp. lm-10]MCL7987413.1 helix-turn-helix domain-containing GNAT family N-acetyltransferase [Sphingobacterium sp. lm-10]
MNVFERTGKMALGSRLRSLTAKFTDDGAGIYGLYDMEFVPKWFPVFFVLSEDGEKTITEIALEIGHSQPSVTKIIKEMAMTGLVKNNLKSKDKRKNVVGLTEKGIALTEKLKELYLDVDSAVENAINQATFNLWEAVAEWEFLLEQKSLLKRVQEQKKLRESKNVQIVDYTPKYKTAFKSLNAEWISKYFEMEEADYKVLDNPEKHILGEGGKILVALYNNEPHGVCALLKMDDPQYDFEMAKMAVSPNAQGKNIGMLLGKAIIEKAKEMGASKIYLESNTILKPAINLYYKLGFQKISGHPSPYKRVNIQMELDLTQYR